MLPSMPYGQLHANVLHANDQRSDKCFCSEGHTAWDAFLSVASSAVGQGVSKFSILGLQTPCLAKNQCKEAK